MAAPKSRINTEFYNKNTIELELKGSNFNGVFTWWERMDSNHRSVKAADLQSVPFGHSGTLPYLILRKFSGAGGRT